jgi:hypothetical protein
MKPPLRKSSDHLVACRPGAELATDPIYPRPRRRGSGENWSQPGENWLNWSARLELLSPYAVRLGQAALGQTELQEMRQRIDVRRRHVRIGREIRARKI